MLQNLFGMKDLAELELTRCEKKITLHKLKKMINWLISYETLNLVHTFSLLMFLLLSKDQTFIFYLSIKRPLYNLRLINTS